jgi:hypothetical protein
MMTSRVWTFFETLKVFQVPKPLGSCAQSADQTRD